ncbi:NUDIX domain-containing protein [Candidatus Dependentiae bacterium]|nr:NUDIX domain-containing protein [Candidatus Dependentiae bacterium]
MNKTINTINKFHFGIYAIILKNTSILLVKKRRGPYIGKLDLPGGKPEYGEIPIQTLKREVLEETGLIVYMGELFDNYSTVAKQHVELTGENTHHMGMIYLIISYDDSALINKMDTEDSLGASWYKLDSLTSDILSPFVSMAIKDINNRMFSNF